MNRTSRNRPDDERQKRFDDFLTWFKAHITGRERKEGQIFFDRLLQAFGNGGVLEAGAACEDPVKKKSGRTGFADLVWKPRVIIELKARDTNLKKHYSQAEEYWMHLVPNRPQYMVLCNFDEFWIYDLNTQLNDPVHTLRTEHLPKEWGALGFLFPTQEKPIFTNNNVEVTEAAAKIVGEIYLSLQHRKIDSYRAQRFVLQLVVALFSEDVSLIPKYTIQKILKEAIADPVTQKELTLLFKAMACEKEGDSPRKYKHIPYFNGGLFSEVSPVELSFKELDLLAAASEQDWSKVRPSVFGSIFEGSMDPDRRHEHGIHYTSELDIQKIVNPTIVRPFREKIEKAKKNRRELGKILDEIQKFKVLDPACGSGNFLYIAFRELRRLEVEILERMDKNFDPRQMRFGLISPKNFYGIDTNEFGLELAKIALCIGRKLSADEFGIADNVLPFDNLDTNFLPKDALFSEWPKTHAIIGNPPFQSKNKMQKELGAAYINKLHKAYPDVPGRADYCVYWFRKAHDHLHQGSRAGLVGTNTIRQNYSREGGLDHIVANGGTITEAVSSQVWSGDAVVHVSIVNWIKGDQSGKKRLYHQIGDNCDSPWEVVEVDEINSSLSNAADVSGAKPLMVIKTSYSCYQGQTHGHEAFLLTPTEKAAMIKDDPDNTKILFPYLTADELLTAANLGIARYVIDFHPRNIVEAKAFRRPFKRIEDLVLPDRKNAAGEEEGRNADVLKVDPKAHVNRHHRNFLNSWWLLSWPREELIAKIRMMRRYIVCGQVTKRPIFEFVSSKINPNAALMAFLFEDDYSFGILQSDAHWQWFTAKCSTLKGDFRYTSNSVFDTFPWPQNPSAKQVRTIADAAVALRNARRDMMNKSGQSLRDLYRSLELPGENPLREFHKNLDKAVLAAYGIKDAGGVLEGLLALNLELANLEARKKKIQGPGLPHSIKNPESFDSSDCLEP